MKAPNQPCSFRLFCCLVLLLSFALLFNVATAVSIKEYPYLYQEANAHPIQEHVAPQGDRERRSDEPAFLYDTDNNNYRIVEW